MVARNAPTTERKKAPTKDDLTAIEMLQRIKKGTILKSEELPSLKKQWQRELAATALDEMKRDGIAGFWRVLETQETDHPELKNWRTLIETEAPPEVPLEEKKLGKYRPKTLLEMAQQPRPSDIIADIFYEKTVGLLFGAAGTKKSFLAFDWLAHIAMGRSWQGHEIKKPGKCIYTMAEGADSFIKRALAWCQYYQVPLKDLSENLLIVDREIPLSNAAEISEYIADIGEYIHNVAPVVVVFDTLMRCSGGENINAPDVMARLYDGANAIRRELDVAHALIVHHEGKDSTRGSAGSFVLRANCDIVHRLTCDEPTGTITLSCNPNVGGKMKDKAEYPDIYLNTHTVYYTEDMSRDDSSLVLVNGSKPAQKVKLNANRQLMLDALPHGAGLSYSEWKDAVDKARKADSQPAMPKQTFNDNREWLIKNNLVRKAGTEGTDTYTYWRVQSGAQSEDESEE